MSDSVYVDLSPVIRAVNALDGKIVHVSGQVAQVYGRIDNVEAGLRELKRDFLQMMKEQRQQAALQRAITEVIRVRQELEQKYGNYKLVRDNMLGILQAADLTLIRESTISNCTEELMISTPNYWLAPCLIALAGWISNNKSLATRAIEIACQRNAEKTSLIFALICRRNGRTDTCFEWLSKYFSYQKPTAMTTSIVAYLDAYSNGVFGVDKDNLCEDHINEWMRQLKQDPEFDNQQNTYWKNIYRNVFLKEDAGPNYVALKSTCLEFAQIDNYAKRIKAVASIKGYFEKILRHEVNIGGLVNAIDNQLIALVSKYDDDEKPLRDEETLLQLIKKHNGDENKAKAELAWINMKNYDKPVNFAERLRTTIMETDPAKVEPSARKTSVKLLSNYIEEAFTEFITENKDAYPTEVTLKMRLQGTKKGTKEFPWQGKVTDGSNADELKKSISALVNKEKQICLDNSLIPEKKIKNTRLIGFVTCIILVGIYFIMKAGKMKKQNEADKKEIESYYASLNKNAAALLDKSILGKQETDKLVRDFEAKEGFDRLNLKQFYNADNKAAAAK